MSLNMDLLKACHPIIKISRLEGACINSPHATLGGTDANKFTSVNTSSVGTSDWNFETETLSMRGQADNNFERAASNPPDLESDTDYFFEFNIKNPVFGQEGVC